MTKRELAKAIMWMMDKGYATGHGDSVVDLLTELEWQVSEREREACALICENMERNGAWITKEEAAAAIRANRSLVTTSAGKPNYRTPQVTPEVPLKYPVSTP
jgi:hypothetical protein